MFRLSTSLDVDIRHSQLYYESRVLNLQERLVIVIITILFLDLDTVRVLVFGTDRKATRFYKENRFFSHRRSDELVSLYTLTSVLIGSKLKSVLYVYLKVDVHKY